LAQHNANTITQNPIMLARSTYALRGIIGGYLTYAASFLAALLLTPLILRYLDPAAYGLWRTLSGSLLSYLTLLDFGLSAALIRFIAHHRSQEQPEQVSRLASTALVLYIGLGLLALIVSGLLALFIGPVLQLPPELIVPGQVALLLVGLQIAAIFLLTVFTGTIAGHERYDVVGGISLLTTILSPVISAILLWWGYGLPGLAASGVVAIGVAIGCAAVYMYRQLPHVRVRLRLFTPSMLRETLRFSVFVFVLNLGVIVINSSDNLVIARVLGIEQVASYTIAYTLGTMALLISKRCSDVLLPVFTDLYSRNDMAALQRLYPQMIRFSTAISCATGLALIFVGGRFIGAWVGETLFVGQQTLSLIALYTLLHGATVHPSLITLQSIGQVRPAAVATLVEAAINLTLSLLLARTALGVAGVALATVLGQLLVSVWFMPQLILRQLHIPRGRFVVEAFARPLLALPIGVLLAVGITAWPADNLLVVVLQGGAIAAAYLGCSFLLAPTADRQFVSQKLRAVLPL
jgi:O-antigen/teichoic acid export membrane protein